MTRYRPRTAAIHIGETIDPSTRASAPNIVMSNSFVVDEPSGFSIDAFGEEKPYVYTRWDNPTNRMLEQKLAALENAEDCVSFATGMAATAAVLSCSLKRGDHIVAIDVHYGGAAELIRSLQTTHEIESALVDTTDLSEVEGAIVPGRTKLLWIETPANPLLTITDIAAVAKIAQQHNVKLVVDSTLATPIATRPLDLGADYVIHSLSKYIGGHGDALGGAVVGSQRNLAAIRDDERVHQGGVLSPFNAWLIARGLATLPIRMRYHSDNAVILAEYLSSHPRVTSVLFPGLATHPGHSVAAKQMDCWGSLLSFSVEDGAKLAQELPKHVDIIHHAVSLGSHRSLIYWLETKEMLRTSFILPEHLEQRYRTIAGEGIFRFAVGLEDPDDLREELERVLQL